MGEFLIPYLPSGLITLTPGQRFSFPIAVDYILFEEITDIAGATSNPLLTIQLENAQSFKLPALLQVTFNKNDDNLRFSVVNTNAFPTSFIISGGRGDVDNQRATVVGNVSIVPDWAAAYSSTLHRPANTGGSNLLIISNAVSVPAQVTTSIFTNEVFYMPFLSINETSGIPGAYICLSVNSAVPTSSALLICESGSSEKLQNPIAEQSNSTNLYIIFMNGATGRASMSYTLDPLASGG